MAKETKNTEETPKQPGVYTLEQYVQRFSVNPGTIASFKYEAKKAGEDLQSPRTKDAWEKAIEAQKKKKY